MISTPEQSLDSARFAADGYAVVPGVLSPAEVDVARAAAAEVFAGVGRARAGVRDPLSRSDVLRQIACSQGVLDLACRAAGGEALIVRAILFDKTPEANWDVLWHQDVTIAVRERHEISGFGPWSSKDGLPHVQPPAAVLERMVTLRLHLDDCGVDNGPLLVVPGSHQGGVIDITALDAAACDRNAVVVAAPTGAAVVMRPLTLHASRKAAMPGHRRVLHLEFAEDPLPLPLRWQNG